MFLDEYKTLEALERTKAYYVELTSLSCQKLHGMLYADQGERPEAMEEMQHLQDGLMRLRRYHTLIDGFLDYFTQYGQKEDGSTAQAIRKLSESITDGKLPPN